MASGWYADPLGRHEKRFFNGLVWTDRVLDGDPTGSDPIGNVSPPTPLAGRNPRVDSGVVVLAPSRGNAWAMTALVFGVVGAVVALLVPFGFVAGAAFGLIGLLFGLRAYRAVEHRNTGSNALATAGLALGSAALILAAYYGSSYYSVPSTVRRAFASSPKVVVVDADPLSNDVRIADCFRSGSAGSPTATGTIVNRAGKKQAYRVTIEFRIGPIVVRSDTTTGPLDGGETGSWMVRDSGVSFKPDSCTIVTPAVASP
jgi:hypothetical protein